MSILDDDMFKLRFDAEAAELSQRPVMTMALDQLTAYLLCCQLQLALRHSENKRAGAKQMRKWLDNMIRALNLGPAMRQVIKLGWDPANDAARNKLDDQEILLKEEQENQDDQENGIMVETIFGTLNQLGLVLITPHSAPPQIFEPHDAEGLALNIMGAAAQARTETFLYRFLRDQDFSMEQFAEVLRQMRQAYEQEAR